MAESLLTLGANANPLINKPEQDMASTAAITNQPVTAAASAVNNDLKSLDYARLTAQKTQIMEDEAKHQQGLNLPLAMSRMEENTLNAVGQIAQINEIKRSADLKQQNQSWVTNQTIDLETKFNDYLRKAKSEANPDGSGFDGDVLNWFNDYEKNSLKNAPSQEGLTDMYARTSAFKINAMRVAGEFQTAMRSKNRINVSTQNVSNLAATAYDNPEALASGLNSVDKLGRALTGDLKDPADVDKFINSAKATLYVSTLKGALARNDFDLVAQLGGNEKLQDAVPPLQFTSIMTAAAKQEEKYNKDQDKIKESKVMTAQYDGGNLSKSMPGSEDIATQSFVDFTKTLGDTSQMKPQDIGLISTSLVRYFSNKNFTSKEVGKIIAGKINTASNPNEAAAYAVTVNSLSKDPTLLGTKVLTEVDAKSRARAYNISDIMQATGDAEKAIALTDKIAQGEQNAPKGGADLLLKSWAGNGTNDVKNKMAKQYDSIFNGRWIGSPLTDNDKAYGAAELESHTKQFLDAGFNVKDALELASDEIKKTRAVTKVNGRDELMVGAPELYYDEQQMVKVKKIFSEGVADYKKTIPTDSIFSPNIGVAPWDGLTQFQSNKERWYLLMDMDNHTYIRDSNKALITIPVKFDEAKADLQKGEQVSLLAGTAARQHDTPVGNLLRETEAKNKGAADKALSGFGINIKAEKKKALEKDYPAKPTEEQKKAMDLAGKAQSKKRDSSVSRALENFKRVL